MPRNKVKKVRRESQIQALDYQLEIAREFFESEKRIAVVIGGFGSGKTTLGAVVALFALRRGGNYVLVARRNLRETENTFLTKVFELADEGERDFMEATWNKNLQKIVHPNNSILFYLSLEEKADHYKKVRSYEFNVVIIDEASEIDEVAFLEADRRVRRAGLNKVMLLSNPVKENHWLYQFVEREKNNILFFRISSLQNPYLPESYIRHLQQYPPHIQKVIIDGYWGDVDIVKTYINLDKEHIALEDEMLDTTEILELSNYSKVLISADWGITHTAFSVGVVDWFNRLHIIDEFQYQNIPLQIILHDLENQLREKWKISIYSCIWTGDVSAKQRNVFGESVMSFLLQRGIYPQFYYYTLESSLKNMQQLLHERIEVEFEGRVSGVIRKETRPVIIIYPNCERTIQAIQNAYKIKGSSIEKDEELEHIGDAVRYLINFYWKIWGQGGGGVKIWSPYVKEEKET